MLELYVLLTLGSLGYLMNNMGNKIKPKKKEINKYESPSMQTIYNSSYSKKAEEVDRMKAAKVFKQAQKPKQSNRIMTMAGEMVDESDFTHENMEPYFGGQVKQNMDIDRNRVLLENFTGVSDVQKQKCEVKSFYDQSKDLGNVYGTSNNTDYYRDRMEPSRIRNNELPIDQVRVGPGLNQGYTATPKGGFQQFEDGEIARAGEKCVDQLRVKTNPKQTFEARVLDGVKTKLPGLSGKMNKNRVETFYQQTPDMLLKTTGANLKQSQIPKYNVKNTTRMDTTTEYTGAATGAKKRKADENVKESARQQLKEGGIRNAVLNMFGLGQKDDYGKANVVVYNNERDLTTTKTYQGNVTSLIKAIVAPIEDLIKITKKQEAVDNPRPYGALNPQMPNKTTLGPDDKMKVTIKETNIHESVNGNLKGSEKISQYNDDVARATTKETNIHESINGNLKPSAPSHHIIWDPTDIARVTIAETQLHDDQGRGNIKGAIEIYSYDPDDVASTTIRETLHEVDYTANMAARLKKGILPNEDEARETMKQTLIDMLYTGQVESKSRGGAYETTEYDAKEVQRSQLADNDYYGQAEKNVGGGYETTEYDAKEVQRSQLADNDYYGQAASGSKKQKSYDDYDNAHIDERKEVLLFGREPTNTGNKEFNCNVNMRIAKKECDDKATRKFNNMDKVYNAIPELSDRQITKNRLSVDIDSRMGYDRIDPALLKAYRDNPYTQSLHSI